MSDQFDDYPYAKPWTDRHGHIRWRFRRGKKTLYLPGAPGDPQFEQAYQAALAGRPVPKPAAVIQHPSSASPHSLKAAWRIYTSRFPEWRANKPATREQQTAVAEEFLNERIAESQTSTWGDMPIADLRRRHLRAILANMADRPHAGRHRLTVLRKMILAALEEEWIETDPSYRLTYRPATIAGFRAWTDEELERFETRWLVGTTPRLIYELALWLGPRRCDLAQLRPEDIKGDKISWKQQKTGGMVTMPITPRLGAVLAVADLSGETIVITVAGKPFSIKSLTGRMRDWTRAAGIQTGCTLHGLRKTLGKRIAESGGTTREAMAALGHDTITLAELYSRDAERERLAREAMEKVVKLVGRRGPKGGG
jgi:integrase